MKTTRGIAQPVARIRAGHSVQRVFFPTAALFAAVAPWLLLGLPGHGEALVDVPTHARGMLFGYVGALIAGYLGGRLAAVHLAILFGLWLAGRLAELSSANPLLTQVLYAGFGVHLCALVVPRFGAAKKWRNRLIVPLLAAITCFPLLLFAGATMGFPSHLALHSLVLMIALLMFFMGGRFITPLLARAYADRGDKLPHRVQPYLEGTTMLLLLCAIALVPRGSTGEWTALPAGLAGVLVLVRLARWRLFPAERRHVDLAALGVGYLWLGLGLLAFSMAQAGLLPLTASLHVIAVGALGTLSSTVMLKTTQGRDQALAEVYYPVIALLSAAVLARYAAGVLPALRPSLLIVTGACWSLNFLLVTYHLVTLKKARRPEGREPSGRAQAITLRSVAHSTATDP